MITRIKLLSYQARLLQSDKPYLALIGGTGSGKTWFLPRWLLSRIVKHPDNEWIVSSPVYRTLKRDPWNGMIKFFQEIGLEYQENRGDLTLEVPAFKAKIYFVSAENPDRMQGAHVKGIIGDEAGLYSKLWWDTAVQRIGFKKGQILLLTTPYSANHWLKSEVLEPWLAGDKRFHVERPRTEDNPYYPKEEIERARRTLPAWRFRMMYYGEFTKAEGLIYPDVTYVDRFPIPKQWTRIRGLDFGFQNPTAIVWLAQDPSTEDWFVYKEVKMSGLFIDELAKILIEDDPKTLTYADPSGLAFIQDLRKRGIKIYKANNDVMPGILSVGEALKSGKLKVFSDLKYFKDEIENYSWYRDRAGTILDKPLKENDHLMDALRYAWYTYGEKGKSKVKVVSWSLAR